ncbi:uncharacterized protein MONOS_8541 [Monocercomonoides exilis]|uniref:uncharacterized protein n=1 Tax=Monocercomonoides exilis TaxID=2049356 RepID=UPI00355AC421|nr:hypothetical protein MONOS_8541 [Monocercomonoides exilis]|eukprot:MONOS_8541.1-p1 / transcript=MONOS_8541.1 / gene=MONOS_8541 / organism=Monocercomonoides_exilis_PA203 / gene_product=unspecified product / transcript_product=unspecified product / location=Mono_scaffold00324:49766-58426(-) / protein_length=2886 / sequence_SO=supercontig / SO=protein_coding / is_pseudo=false
MHLFKEMLKDHIKSKIEGCVCASNSSIELKEIGLAGGECGSVVHGRRGSVVVVRGCVVGMGKDDEAGAFDLCGCIGILSNITSKGWERGGDIYSGRLLGGSDEGEGSISVSESHFSSFCVSSAPFLSSPSIPLVCLSHLTFFNISTANEACSPSITMSAQTNCFMNSCSFTSVCEAYDGGIVPSLNNPLVSLTASNTSFVRCCRTRNVECEGTSDGKLTPGRQNETENGANSFTWCEWNGSRTTGTSDSISDGISSGGAINMFNKASGTLSVKFCSFNYCYAHYGGGGIMCYSIYSIKIENNSFNSCTAQNQYGGGMSISSISTCVCIGGCEFQKCYAYGWGGGLYLEKFQVSGTGCIPTENGEGESACVFDCCFTSCSISGSGGGGMFCKNVPATLFKMRSIKFISCSAASHGGGLFFSPWQDVFPSDKLYCFFLFFHDCSCSSNPSYGDDIHYEDRYSLCLYSNNPFKECFTTNTDEKRVCYAYDNTGSIWSYQHTEKKDWLKEKTIFVSVSGNDNFELCGANTTFSCLTVKKALEMCETQISLTITLMGGNHTSETTTIEIGTKKISFIGTGRMESSIGTGALSSVGALFSVTTGHLGMSQLKVDCNSNANPSSPSVVVVSGGSGSLSLEDVVITTSKTGEYVMSSSVFVVPLSQLSMVDVEIKDMNVSKPLFSEPDLSSSFSSSFLFLSSTTSGESMLANVNVMNVKLTEGDGVVVAKSVKAGETFVVRNVTIENCECKSGSGGGIKVDLLSPTSKHEAGTTTINRCTSGKYGGGMMLHLADNSVDFSIVSVDFSGCEANSGGNYVFVNGSDSVSWGITTEKLDVQRDDSKYNELVGYDRNNEEMGQFPLNVYFDTFPKAAHVGKAKNNLGGYDSWFCGFDYYPCATITHAAQVRYPDTNKKIELDIGFELAEEIAITGVNEWLISCASNNTNMKVIHPSSISSDWLINAQSTCKIENITFSLPTELAGVTSLILANSTSLTLTSCSITNLVQIPSGAYFGYSVVKGISGKLNVVKFIIEKALPFGERSLVEFEGGVNVVYFKGCIINSIDRKNGDGGLMEGAVGEDFGGGSGGIVVIESCIIKNCKSRRKDGKGGKGGGICVSMKGEGSVVVNGSCEIDGCEAYKEEDTEGKGGGMMVEVLSWKSKLAIGSGVKFSEDTANKAKYGKDVFVCCDSGIFLESKVNANSFKFFEKSAIPSDELKFCGSEDGKDEKVIPLFVYLFSIGSKLTVDGKGEVALDHSSCGFEKFGCLTIDYCVISRVQENMQKVEVSSESSIKSEMKVLSFDVSLTGKEIQAGEKMKVEVKDGGELNQNGLIECTKSFEMTNLAFVMNKEINGRRTAFIHSSSSTITITSCSVTFSRDALADEKIGYNILNIEGGELIVDGLMMENAETLTMNGKSPITITNGEKLDIKNSRVSGVTVEGGSVEGGGCISAGIKEGESAVVDNCNISTTCTGGGGMKGGGMMISAEKGGSLEIKSVTFTGCQVPAEDNLQKGRGMGGGMFVRLADTMGSFKMEGVTFSRCNAWKGKKVFISGNELDEVMSNEQLKWGLSASDEKSLDGLCGWERMTTGEEGYVIPLVVYLWRNWSGEGFVSVEKGGDFSGCGFSEAPCSSIDHLISLRYEPLGKGECQISIGDSGSLSHPISFLSSLPTLPDSEAPVVVIKGTKKGTSVTITDEDGNAVSSGAMISSSVSLSFFNLSFTKPSIITHHAVFIESSGTNTVLSVTDCSFGSSSGTVESFAYCVIKVNGGSAAIQSCTLNKINELKGFITFSPSASQVTIRNVNISSATLTANSLISMTEEENQTNGEKKGFSNGNRPVLSFVGCSFETIKNEGSSASVIELGSFENAIDCTIEECTMSICRSDLSTEGGGMRVVLKSGESALKVNDSSFSMCKCSTETGRGGGLFIDGADSNTNYADVFNFPPLNFKVANILFAMNEAHVGKNMFVRCHSIEHQISETLFALNYTQESLNSNNSICGRDAINEIDVDLIPLITYFYGLQVFVNGTGSDSRRCGAQSYPCMSINCGVDHIQEGVMNAILIDGEGVVSGECSIGDLVVNSLKKTQGIVRLKSKIEKSAEKDCIMELINKSSIERCSFQFEDSFEASHNCLMKVMNGTTKIQECKFISSSDKLKLNSSIASVESGELRISETIIRDIHSTRSVLLFNKESDVTLLETRMSNIECEGDVVSVRGKAKVEMKEMTVENVTLLTNGCAIEMEEAEQGVSVLNCSFGKCGNSVDKGSMMQIRNSKNVRIKICVFDGEKETEAINEGNKIKEGLCKWNGSLVDIEKSNVEMRETTIRNSKAGGLWVNGGSVKIEKGEFENNNPSIEGYPSARRNVICEGNGELDVVSVKGGDGIEKNTSLWILDEGCELGGIASERTSSFFIPILEEVKNTTQPTGEMELIIHGKLLLPCNLSVKISMKDGDVELSHTNNIAEDGYISENEVHSVISSEVLKVMEKKTEVSVCIVFGKGKTSCSNGIVVVNKSESQSKGEHEIEEREREIEEREREIEERERDIEEREREIEKGGRNTEKGDDNINKAGKSNEWSVIVIVVMAALFLIFVFVFVVSVVIHRKKLNEVVEKIEKMGYKEGTTINKREKSGESFEMIEMPSTLLEGMTSQIPLLIEDEEYSSESPTTSNYDNDDNDDDEILNENDLSVFGFPPPRSEDVSVSGVLQQHSLKVISAKKPFREKEKKNLKTLHSVIHSVEGDFTLGTRAMDVVDGKEVVLAVAELFEHLISVEDERVEMMGKQLCPYTIFVEEGNNEIFVLTEELEDEKEKEEAKRWSAPEVGNEDEGIGKAVVFALGLILHEMTTGEEPLSECDTEEAQEMMRDGVRPLTEGIEGEELVELMEKMWGDEPNDRPSLAKVKKWMKRIIKAG